MGRKRILSIDSETTGLNADVDQIVELSFISLENLYDSTPTELTVRFRPSVAISREAEKLHGLKALDLIKCPTFADRAAELKRSLDEAEVLLGYRIDFDIAILSAEFRRSGMSLPHWSDKVIFDPYHCMRPQTARRLIDVYKKLFGKGYEPLHSSLADAQAVLRVTRHMIGQLVGKL